MDCALFLLPYNEAAKHVEMARTQKPVSLAYRVSHCVLALILAIPIIGHVIYFAMHFFNQLSTVSGKPLNNRIQIPDPNGLPPALQKTFDRIPDKFNIGRTEFLTGTYLEAWFLLEAALNDTLYVHSDEVTRDTLGAQIQNDLDKLHTIKRQTGVDLKQMAYFVNIDHLHWVLVFADLEKGTLESYDPMQEFNDGPLLEAVLGSIATTILSPRLNKDFTFLPKVQERIQPQDNAHDCGVLVCYFLEQRLSNKDFNPNAIPKEERAEICTVYRNLIKLRATQVDAAKTETFNLGKAQFARHHNIPVSQVGDGYRLQFSNLLLPELRKVQEVKNALNYNYV